MVPLGVLIVVSLVVLAVRRSWPVAVRGGLAAMFTVTGLAHFIGMREELISMVPPALPAPGLLVTITGVLELAGALGLLWARTAPWAAAGLTAMLVAMFPANVHKALSGPVAFDDQLLPRSAMQVVFLAACIAVVVHYRLGPVPGSVFAIAGPEAAPGGTAERPTYNSGMRPIRPHRQEPPQARLSSNEIQETGPS